jgi:elongation factor Ts
MPVEISAQSVQQLREKTGLGLMQCKKALSETDGDLEKAVEYLRKQGASVATKRMGRDTKEGKVVFASAGSDVAVLEINCETDFVSSSGDFNVFAEKAVKSIVQNAPKDIEAAKSLPLDGATLGEVLTAIIAKIGENITLRRFAMEKTGPGEHIETYSHMAGKIGVIVKVGFDGEVKDKAGLSALTKDLAMQVAATAPIAIESRDVSPALVGKEREIARELTIKEGKTGDMLERIVEGKLNKFFKENCLLQQVFVKDNKTVIDKLLAGASKTLGAENLRVLAFHRFQLGQ